MATPIMAHISLMRHVVLGAAEDGEERKRWRSGREVEWATRLRGVREERVWVSRAEGRT
jgi:hypothetical protein